MSRQTPPNVNLTQIVRNRSSRDGARVALAVIHTTEGSNYNGPQDLHSLAAWFDNPASQASAHIGVDADGLVMRMVPDAQKAWTCAAFNAGSLNMELVGFAATTEREWYLHHHPQLRDVARWLEYWARDAFPLRRAKTSGTSVMKSGVATHKQLGAAGGGHTDPGKGFPVDYVIWLAKLERNPNDKRSRQAVNNRRAKYGLDPINL